MQAWWHHFVLLSLTALSINTSCYPSKADYVVKGDELKMAEEGEDPNIKSAENETSPATAEAKQRAVVVSASGEEDVKEEKPAEERKTMPRRFRSAFILFSSERHKQIRQELGQQGKLERVSAICCTYYVFDADWTHA